MQKIILFLLFFSMNNAFAVLPETLRFGTEAAYPPFEFIDASGEIKGFDIDLANALCKEMKTNCTFQNQSFSTLIPSLKLGKFDAIIAALGVTKEREKQVAFSQAYYEPSGAFVTANANTYTLQDVSKKTIGVQIGSTFEKYLQTKYKDQVTIKHYSNIQDAFLDLKSKRIDIVLADTPIAINWLNQDGDKKHFHIIEKPVIDHQYFGNGYAIAVDKNNTALLNAINAALKTIQSNGIYQQLMKKYFDIT